MDQLSKISIQLMTVIPPVYVSSKRRHDLETIMFMTRRKHTPQADTFTSSLLYLKEITLLQNTHKLLRQGQNTRIFFISLLLSMSLQLVETPVRTRERKKGKSSSCMMGRIGLKMCCGP